MIDYEIILTGFNARTDETDHLVKWVKAPNIEAAAYYATCQGWCVRSIEVHEQQGLTEYDGLDGIAESRGSSHRR